TGCTGLHDCGLGMLGGPQDIEAVQRVMRTDPPIRYSAFLVSTHMQAWQAMGLTPNTGNDRFKLTGIKLWADGSNQGLTGYQRVPYLNSSSCGALNYTPEQITEGMQTAHDLGWQIGVHANGDAAIDVTLQAYETVLTKRPRNDHRHRIEHCSVLHADQIRTMARLGLSPSFLIGHVYYWGRAFRDAILGPERVNLYDPCASALAGGLRVSLHSDYDVTPIEPLRYIENAVTRVMRDGGDVLNPAERITVEQAIKAVTLDAAWQCRIDDVAGSLETGKRADLVILEKDPTAVDPSTIRSIAVMETWLDGARRYSA
ncbi:MAG: amidohydrolase, partial [Dehalococcoidia bacterium]